MWRGFPTGWLQGQVLNGSRSTRVCRQLGLQAWAACRRRTDVAQTGAGSEDTFLSLLSLSHSASSPLLSSSPSLPLIHDPSTSRSAPCLLEPGPAFLSLQSPEESVLPVPWRAVLASLICFSTGFPSTPRGVARGPSRLPDSPSVLFSVSPLSSPNIFIPSRLSLLHRLGTQRSVPPPLSSELECNPRSCSQLHVASHWQAQWVEVTKEESHMGVTVSQCS